MTIQETIRGIVENAVSKAQTLNELPDIPLEEITIDRPQNPEHGDFASSLPLKLTKVMKVPPMIIADKVTSHIEIKGPISKAAVTNPGFINLFVDSDWLASQVELIIKSGDKYGNSARGSNTHIQIEFVSVNPTGPLHVGHARGAVFGSALAEILMASGYKVHREYYFNDAGSQIQKFYSSLYARYMQLFGREELVPEDGYQGQYMVELAKDIKRDLGAKYHAMTREDAVSELGREGINRMVETAKSDMQILNVSYDTWFEEKSLFSEGQYDRTMKLLSESGYLTEKDEATWLKSTSLGDDEDKVMVRRNGIPTYFATDVAYHYNKFLERRFDRVINVLGADHQGHARFMKAVPLAIGINPDRLNLIIYQLVTLKRGQDSVRASKRSGQMETLKDLVDDVGPDACRFFFLSRSPRSQMEFDLDLAKKQSSENPVFYIQYAHARICSILKLAEKNSIDYSNGNVALLQHKGETSLIKKMLEFPEIIQSVSETLEPHHLPHYSVELSTMFHWFYESCRVVSDKPQDVEITKARLKLVEASRIVLNRCLKLMLMSAPTEM
tara:strand:- start:1225 stop:2895 length:1671 start_codon:yes stop_codon:yes gene_type:complete